MSAEKVSVDLQIPEDLYEKLELIANRGRLPSVESYVNFLLASIYQDSKLESSEVFDESEEEELKRRLRSLGYT